MEAETGEESYARQVRTNLDESTPGLHDLLGGHHVVPKWKSKGFWIYEHNTNIHCEVECSSSSNILSCKGRD